MRVVIFCHSILSDWNHGNAHFLRGVARELMAGGHGVRVFEPRDAWSLANLVAEHGPAPLEAFRAAKGQVPESTVIVVTAMDYASAAIRSRLI